MIVFQFQSKKTQIIGLCMLINIQQNKCQKYSSQHLIYFKSFLKYSLVNIDELDSDYSKNMQM